MIKKSFLLLLVLACGLFSAVHETIPPYDWVYEYINLLQNRGYLLQLDQMSRPYTRGRVAQELVNNAIIQNKAQLQQVYKKLVVEFAEVIKLILDKGTDQTVQLSLLMQNDINTSDGETVYRGVHRGSIGVPVGSYFYAHNTLNYNQYDYHDPNYLGDKWRGGSAYNERSYLHFVKDRFSVKFGRDFLSMGVGESGKLLLHNIEKPMDHLLATITIPHLKFSFFTAELDQYKMKNENDTVDLYNRYLAGHRFDFWFLKKKLQVSFSEFIIYSGVNEHLRFAYLNPFNVYYGVHLNKYLNTNVNFIPSIDVLYYVKPNVKFYTSVLIDDIQVEKTVPGDLEPNEIGWIIGSIWADPLNFSGLALNAEYTRVANRTYKTPHPAELYVHRNQPLGHPMGNDFDHWRVGFDFWPRHDLKIMLNYLHTRHGEGSLYTPFDMPWMDFTIEEGYSEPFPTGVVETSNGVRANVKWFGNKYGRLYADLYYRNISNYENVKGENEQLLDFVVTAEIDLSYKFKLE